MELNEAKELCDWLIDKGLGVGECADFLMSLGCGDTFAIALFKVFEDRKKIVEKIYEKISHDEVKPSFSSFDWLYGAKQKDGIEG